MGTQLACLNNVRIDQNEESLANQRQPYTTGSFEMIDIEHALIWFMSILMLMIIFPETIEKL